MTPVMFFPAGPLDSETARVLALHERIHLLHARGLDPEARARAESAILEFERTHGADVRPSDVQEP